MTPKHKMCVGMSKKCRAFRMCVNLNDCQFKTNKISYRPTSWFTDQKPTIDTQNLERKEPKNNTKENHQTTREEEKNREQLQTQPESN